jgi:hypothetical protein
MSAMMGSRVTARPSQIRMFLRADTPVGLVRLQLQNNIKLMGRADYTDIQFVNGQWYCWFMVDIDQNPQVLKQDGARK